MRRLLTTLCLTALAACSGAGNGSSVPATSGTPAAPRSANSSALAPTSFVFGKLTTPSSTRRAQYVTASVQSVTIALTSVNGSAPAAGLTTSVATNVNLTNCPCTVAGPAVPPGSDGFTLSVYDGQNGTGNVISTATPTLTILPNVPNTNTITLNGVPARFALSLPAATAGTAFGATSFSVTVQDADGNTIMGSYQNAVTLTDSDTTGATTLATAGSDSPAAGQLVSSSDTATIAYTGLAIAPVTVMAAASGATSGTRSFAPVLQPIVTTAPLNGATPEIALTRDTASGNFTASEAGWTNAPYNRSITATPTGCSTIGTTAPSSGTTFTTTVAGAPGAGSCTLALSDFVGGSATSVTLAYVSGSQTLSYTGAPQSFMVPFGVSTVTVAATGAGGGGYAVGFGASVTATFPATAGATWTVQVGGAGTIGTFGGPPGGAGGYGGGGAGGAATPGGGATVYSGGGGGGASSVTASSLLLVAGGGGGGNECGYSGSAGANGGYPTGGTGTVGGCTSVAGAGGGAGGTQLAAGSGGIAPGNGGNGSPGTGGTGGAGGTSQSASGLSYAGGGGGGGYFGGGGGAGGGTGGAIGGGGGGGSSYYAGTATNVTASASTAFVQYGNGQVVLSW